MMKTRTVSMVATACLAAAATALAADAPPKHDGIEAGITAQGLALGQVRPMTVEFAKRIVAAAKKASCSPPNGACSGAFAVVDDTGVLVNMETIDGVLAGGPDLAIRKAKTSAIWRRPTQVFLDAVDKKTNVSYADGTFPDMTTSPGGYPIFKDGRVVGGFGTAAVGSFDATHQIDAAVRAEAEKIFGKQP
jgi:uncharacterized protein GlcG (DUF336 family)